MVKEPAIQVQVFVAVILDLPLQAVPHVPQIVTVIAPAWADKPVYQAMLTTNMLNVIHSFFTL